MPQAPAFLSTDNAREQLEADDRLKSALLSRFILAGLSERDAIEASGLVAGLAWFLIAATRVRQEVRS